MTFTNQTNRVSAVGSGAVDQEVPFSFPVTDTTDLTVIKRVTATGVETTLTETTNYTVTITGDTGGTLTTVTTIETTEEIHIIRDTPNTQELDLEQGGTFNAENVEDALDKSVKLTVENDDAMTRSLRAPATDATSVDMELPNSVDRADQYLAFDSDGDPTVVASVAPATATVTAFAETFLNDANAAAVRTTLDVQQLDSVLTDLTGLSVTNENIMEADGSNWTVLNKSTFFTGLVDEILTFDGAVLVYDGDVLTYF